MTRLQRGNHAVIITGLNDGTKQASKDAWNDVHNQTGFLGFTQIGGEIIIATGVCAALDTLTFAGAETGTADTLDRFDNTDIADKDLILLFATIGDTITVTHTETPSVAGHIHFSDHQDRVASSTEAIVLFRVGTFWYEFNMAKSFLDSEFSILDEADRTKKAVFSLGGATTAKTITFVSSHTDNRSWTYPDATDTAVGKATTDIMTNKTLTAPKIVSGGFLADANGNELIIFTTVTSAVNEITIANAAASGDPIIAASGETNVNLKLAGKGTGVVYGNREVSSYPLSDEATVLTTGVKYVTEPAPYNMTISDVIAGLTVAGTGAALVTVDILLEDTAPNTNTFTTIFSTKPTIDASEFSSTTAAAAMALSVTAIPKGHRLQLKIDTIDTNNLAAGLKVTLIMFATAK